MQTAIVAFVPVIHAGYLDFFKRYPGTLFVIGPEFYPEFPKLERDLRSLRPIDIQKALGALSVSTEVCLLEKGMERDLKRYRIVMPSDELSVAFAEKYLSEASVIFEPIFLRWNRIITTSESVVPPDRTISHDDFDREMMGRTKTEAHKSSDWWRQIGAIAVRGSEILVSAYNRHLPNDISMDVYGDPRSNFDAGEQLDQKLSIDITPNDLSTAIHAEANMIAQAARQGIKLEGASCYVSTFPCPTCAKLIAEAGIKKVFYEKGYSLVDAERVLRTYQIEIVLVD